MTVIPLNPTQPAAAADEPAAAGDQPAGGEAYPLPLVMADPARLLLADNVSVDAPGGEHRYFTVTTAADQNKARSTAGTLGWLVDTRGVGGYVIAAGSVCRIDGRRRYYRGTSPPGTPLVPAPRWLLDALTPLARATTSSEPLGCPNAYARTALHAEADQVRRAAPGTRNPPSSTPPAASGNSPPPGSSMTGRSLPPSPRPPPATSAWTGSPPPRRPPRSATAYAADTNAPA